MRLLVFIFLLLGGCAHVKPTASVAVTYTAPHATHYTLQSERAWQCAQPQFRGEVGGITKSKFAFGLYHESMVLCGTGNGKPELYENGVYLRQQWGGW